MAVSDNGIFARANRSRIAAIESQCKEQIGIDIMTVQIDNKGGRDLKTLYENLPKVDNKISLDTYHDGDTVLSGTYDYNNNYKYVFEINDKLEISGVGTKLDETGISIEEVGTTLNSITIKASSSGKKIVKYKYSIIQVDDTNNRISKETTNADITIENLKAGTNYLVTAIGYDSEENRYDSNSLNVRTLSTYKIEYSLDSGTAGAKAPTDGTYNQVIEISNPTREGYTFLGWTAEGINTSTAMYGAGTDSVTTAWTDSNTKVTASYFKNLTDKHEATVKLIANWGINSYTISYDLDGGTISNQPTSYLAWQSVTIPNPTKSDYTFTGWSGANTTTLANGGYAEDISLTANWKTNDIILYAPGNNAAGVTFSEGSGLAYNHGTYGVSNGQYFQLPCTDTRCSYGYINFGSNYSGVYIDLQVTEISGDGTDLMCGPYGNHNIRIRSSGTYNGLYIGSLGSAKRIDLQSMSNNSGMVKVIVTKIYQKR